MRIKLLPVLFAGLLFGCSGNGVGQPGGSGGTGGGGAGGSGGSGGTGGTGGSGGSGDVVTIQTTPFTVDAAGEVFMCQDFANPFGGADAEIQEIDSDMTTGSHHMLLFYKDNAVDTGAAVACDPLQFSSTPYGSQSPHNAIAYPDGIAALIKSTQGFHLQMHYLNATQQAITAQVTVNFHRAVAGTVTQHAGVFFFNNITGIHVAGGQTQDVTQTCTFASNVNVMYAIGHTHRFTNMFTATIGGNSVYSTTSWDASPNQAYAPPIQVAAGTPVTWTCNITNPNPSPSNILTFGESALTNDMCIFDGQYYPANDASPTINCMK